MGIPGLTQYAQKAVPIAQQSVAAASVGATYAVVGAVFSNPIVLVIIVSTLNATVQVSWDGVTDHIPVVAGATIVLDFRSDNVALPGVDGVYVKQIGVPATGSLYVSAFTL